MKGKKTYYKLQISCYGLQLPIAIYNRLLNDDKSNSNLTVYNLIVFRRNYEEWKNSIILCMALNQKCEETGKARELVAFLNNVSKEIENHKEGVYTISVNMAEKMIELFYFDSTPYSNKDDFVCKTSKGVNMSEVTQKIYGKIRSSSVELSTSMLCEEDK